MRRLDREVADIGGIDEILRLCKTCHLAMIDNVAPYVVPLSYGYKIMDGNVLELYFHSAYEGRKLDVLRRNNTVCFEMSSEGEAIITENPCNAGSYFSSIIGYGEAIFIEEAEEKCSALSILFKHQTGRDVAFTAEQSQTVCVFKIVSKDFTGKRKQKIL